MHELPIVESIVSVVLRHAQKNNVCSITKIFLQVGEFSDLQDQWIQRYFDFLSKDTIVAGAKLHIERVPVMFRCHSCKCEFAVKIREIDMVVCPECKGTKLSFLSGNEYTIKSIEVIL